MTTTVNSTYLDLVGICDNVHLRREGCLYDTAYHDEILVPLHLTESPDSPVIGLLRPVIIDHLKLENDRSRSHGTSEMWILKLDASEYVKSRNGHLSSRVSLCDWLDTPSKRTAAMKELCERWRDTLIFPDVCGLTKWRGEMYPVYADPFGIHDHPLQCGTELGLNYSFELERCACALFGIVTYGVHMSIYDEISDKEGGKAVRVWVPRRALTKPTWPGYLDNTVAGGIPSGLSVFDSLLKECAEEASLEPDIVRRYTRAVGSISYFFRTPKGWLQPEVEYTYDICIPSGANLSLFTPRPMDGEVESFELVAHDKLLQQLRSGLFKPNSSLVIIDLLIRLGFLTPDNEPNLLKIITRIHGNFSYDKW